MKARLVDEAGQKTCADLREERRVIDELTSFAKENKLGGSHFTATGAFRDVMLGYFDRDKKTQGDSDSGAGGSAFAVR